MQIYVVDYNTQYLMASNKCYEIVGDVIYIFSKAEN